HGTPVQLAPLAFGTLFDRTPGVELFQIEQTTPTTLRVRLLPATDADPDHVWHSTRLELTRLLTDNKLDHIAIQRADEPPRQTPGGKYRTVIPFDQPHTRP
ncbi:CoF synthetase, partial [Streptomyces sp. WAC 06725]